MPALIDLPVGHVARSQRLATPVAKVQMSGLGTDIIFVIGMVTISLQAIQVGMAQPGHLWMLIALGIGLLRGRIQLSAREGLVFTIFLAVLFANTYFQHLGRVKTLEQIIKFGFIYPGFYCVGRWLGNTYSDRKIPIGYLFLFGWLIFQFFIQILQLPYLYKELTFGGDALHGSFKERNWLALYFLLFSYIIFLKWRNIPGHILFFGLNAFVMLLSGSKTAFIGCGIIFLIHSKTPLAIKIALIAAGGALYWSIFSSAFSQQEMDVRLEQERGLAFQYGLDLIRSNYLGYGVGYVEWFFSAVAGTVKGLGEGTNAIFCTPMDLMIIAGFFGLGAWAFFFAGAGLGVIAYLVPVATLSLLNPLHQSELVYLFIGLLVSFGRISSGLETPRGP
jgi:hypothetical protein